eukprot:g5665.t1
MAIPKPKAPRLTDPTETSVNVAWEKVDGATGYIVLVKEVPEEWNEAKRHEFNSDINSSEIDGLSPTCTFQIKLIVKTAEGDSEPSDESVVDTLVANCGPDQDKKKCCIVS